MKRIGRYVIKGLLGRGGMGKVYKVLLPAIGKTSALKRFEPDPMLERLMGRKALEKMFIAEAATMAGLRHPHVVDVLDFDTADGRPFYVMDFFGNNLGATIGETHRTDEPSRQVPIDKAIDYIDQTLDGLACLHHVGIVHRDIKPFNLLITEQDRIKICDFGLSRVRGETFAGPAQLKVGSPYYAAPEQENAPDTAGPAADMFSVGIIFYRMLTGRLPDALPTNSRYLPASRLTPDIDDTWDRFIKKAIDPDASRRFESAAAMRAALAELKTYWQRQKEAACRLDEVTGEPIKPAAQAISTASAALRAAAIKIAPRHARKRFALDHLWRPRPYPASRFRRLDGQLIIDEVNDLIWQQAGSPYPLTWPQARIDIERLNSARFGGRGNWQLPTIAQLTTLLTEATQGHTYCIEPVFDASQRWLWSADRRSWAAAWYVDAEMGCVGWQDNCARFFVRAVSAVGA